MGGGIRNEFLDEKFPDKVDELAMLELRDIELLSEIKSFQSNLRTKLLPGTIKGEP